MKVRGAMRRLVPLTLLVALLGALGLPARQARADNNPTVNVADATTMEGNSGTTNMVFIVSLTTKSQNDVTVVYNTSDGTTQAGVGYTYTAGSLVIPAGSSSKTISVPVIGNVTPTIPAGPDKTFSMNLASATNATLGVATATGTIYEDDVTPALTIESTAVPRGAGGTSSVMTFPVLLSPPSLAPVSVKYSSANSSAIAGVDYTAASGVVNFAPGVTMQNISVTEFGKNGLAPDATYGITLANPVNARILTGTATGTIQSDRVTSRLVIGDAGIVKPASGTSVVHVPVKLVPASTGTVTVFANTSDGSAHAGTDYVANATTLTFNPGVVSQTFDVTVDSGGGAGTFGVSLSTPTGAVTSNTSATVVVQANGAPAPQFTVQDTAVQEGNSGSVNALVTIALTNAAASTVSVTATTVDGSAKAGTDYTATGPTVETFTAGQTTKTFTVPINPDTIVQGNRSFTVNLSASTGPTILRTSATITILDDDLLAAIQMTDATLARPTSGTGTMTFTVSLAAPSANTVSVPFNTANGNAISTVHYTAASGTVTFNPGQVSKNVNVTILANPANDVDRTFTLNLGTPTNGFASTVTTTGLILDEVAPSQIFMTGTESFACTKKMVFTVSLDHASAVPVGVSYTTGDSSAKAGTDYTTTSGTLNFPAGTTSQTITVPVMQNANAQADRTLTMTLSAPTNAVISTNSGTVNGIIRNQNITPGLTVSDGAVVEPDGTNTTQMTFTVSIVPAAALPTAVTYQTTDGSATSPSSYIGTSGTLNFAAGDTTKQVSVTINGNDVQDGDRTFTLNVTGPPLPAPPLVSLRPAGTGTILDNDIKAVVNAAPGAVQRPGSGTKVLNVPVYLSPASNQDVKVNYSTTDGSAIAPTDYTAVSGTLDFPPGTTSQVVPVTVKSSATVSALTFSLALSSPVNATIGSKNNPTLTIFPSSGAITPTAWVQSSYVTEGDSGTTNMTVTVGMAPAPTTKTFLNYSTGFGTATAGVDYTFTQGTLVFTSGQTSQTFVVPVIGDTVYERPAETVSLLLAATNLGGVSVVDGSATGTIVDNDFLPVLDVTDAAVVEGNVGPTMMTFNFNIMPANPNATSIDVLTGTSSGTQPGRDFVTTSATVNFPAGTTTGSISVPVIPNTTVDAVNKKFSLNLSNPLGLQNPHSTALGLIVDADTFNVTGTVKDGTGATVSGVAVTSSKGQSGTSDGSGNYVEPDNLNGTTFTVHASGGGRSYFPAASASIKLCGADVKQNFLALSGNFIEGQVTDTKGKALAGVTVTRTGNAQPTVMSTSDANGFYGFSSNPNGTYTVTASKTGDTFAPPSYSAVISGAPSTTNDFIAMTGNTISGRVTLQSNGNPVAGVLVTATSSGHPTETFTTGASGYYALSAVPGSAGGVTWSVQPSKTGKSFTPPGAFVSVHNGDQIIQNFLSS
jgi:hypothetical protein